MLMYVKEIIPKHMEYNKSKDSVLCALKELKLEVAKLNSTLDYVMKQCERDKVATAMHVSLE